MVRTSGFHPDNRGSIPLGDAKKGKDFPYLFFLGFSLDTKTVFNQQSLLILSQYIQEALGNEIFCIGFIDDKGLVSELNLIANGNEDSVPVLLQNIQVGDVLIHNHPSGILIPSDADLVIASKVAQMGFGFYIINNSLTEVYIVTNPLHISKKQELDIEQISGLLQEDGAFAARSTTYELRSTQIELTKKICSVFNKSLIGVFEAGTGVGKSFAYLFPSIFWAFTNKERVVISTGTINLQYQLFEKDIPAALGITGKDLKCVLLKGRQNYVCLRRLQDLVLEIKQDGFLFEEDISEIATLAQWAENSLTGSKSELSFIPKESLWTMICSESDLCMGLKCPFYADCFVMKVRKEAAAASIIVVNHHLLFSDIEARMNGAGYEDTVVLPPFKNLIFDEAHGIEDAATSFFSESFTRFRILKILNIFWRSRQNHIGGHLINLQSMSLEPFDHHTVISLIAEIKELYASVESTALTLLGNSYTLRVCDKTYKTLIPLLDSLHTLYLKIKNLCESIKTLISSIDEQYEDDSIVWESKSALRRLESLATLCQNFSDWKEKCDSVFWIEKRKISGTANRNQSGDLWYPRFFQTPISIASMMKDGIFSSLKNVVCTSATLKVGNSFNFWNKRVGINLLKEERILSGAFDSPFPYHSNVILCIPKDAPSPELDSFQPWIETAIVSLIQASNGHTLVLFTSYESLRSACVVSRKAFAHTDISILMQGDLDRARLLEQFKNDEQSVLFATDSFWEGIDAPGDTLLQVIIVKLPFPVPNEPILEARSEFVTKEGLSPFFELSIPHAVIKFRQGFGRLIRKTTDKGIVTVLDKRLLTKQYGAIFLNSIPNTKKCFEELQDVVRSIELFLYN